VFKNGTSEVETVQGVEALAKLINEPVDSIPKVYIHKVTFSQHTVYEFTRDRR